MNFTIKGVITKIVEEQKGTSKAGKEWVKGGFVLDNGDEYNNINFFDIFGEDKLNQFDFKVGDKLEVFFNINTNEYEGRFFTSLQYWKAQMIGAQSNQSKPTDEDELPF